MSNKKGEMKMGFGEILCWSLFINYSLSFSHIVERDSIQNCVDIVKKVQSMLLTFFHFH